MGRYVMSETDATNAIAQLHKQFADIISQQKNKNAFKSLSRIENYLAEPKNQHKLVKIYNTPRFRYFFEKIKEIQDDIQNNTNGAINGASNFERDLSALYALIIRAGVFFSPSSVSYEETVIALDKKPVSSDFLLVATWELLPRLCDTKENTLNDYLTGCNDAYNKAQLLSNELKTWEQQFNTVVENIEGQISEALNTQATNLAGEFNKFKVKKYWEQGISALVGISLIIALLVIGFKIYDSGKTFLTDYDAYILAVKQINAQPSASSLLGKANNTSPSVAKLTPPSLAIFLTAKMGLILLEGFLIYLFRIVLNNYYAARDEILQLRIRESLCKFIPAYREFCKDNNCQLEDFARHIFSPLNSRINPAPHPMDFLGQITQAVGKGNNN